MENKLLEPHCSRNPIVFLDINIGPEFAGRIVIELRKDVVPRTAENFRALCTGEHGIGTLGKPLHYKGIRFHKVTRVFAAQSGDVVNNDGTSGESIYGPIFEDENFTLLHEDGVVSMTNYGKPNTNNSQFVITSGACENLDGTNVVVGKMLRGNGIIGDMEQNTTDEGKPTQEIIIADCGEIPPGQDWGISDNDETDDHLPPYPHDWSEKFNDLTIDEMQEVLVRIRNAGNHFFGQQKYLDARRRYRKANRYYQLMRSRSQQKLMVGSGRPVSPELQQLDNFSVLNMVNMAAVELKLKEYGSAKYSCTEALRMDPKCSKAYFRRGQAHLATQYFEEAINDLKEAHELVPNNKQILGELNNAKQMLADYNRKQMNALKHLFK